MMEFIFAILILIISHVNASKLNVPRVLLPYNHEFPSNFTLKILEGGCYMWTSSHQEVILEEVVVNGCSNEIIVSAASKSPTRLNAIVLAKDVGTGFSHRCDVIVDSIHRLQIVTTTRELYAEEAPEKFEVRAYDVYGNEFSTLEGQIFVWNLQNVGEQDTLPAHMVLRFISFEASPYKTPPAIAPIESKGKQGYMVLVEGIQTGLARLSVRLAHSAYRSLPPNEVDLMVVANLLLEPQDSFLLSQATISYSVFHLKQGLLHPVQLSTSQYYLHVTDELVATLDDNGVLITAQNLGTTSVVLQDVNVKMPETLKQPTANLHVVEPSHLSMTILPHNNPALIVGHSYDFLVNIFDRNNNHIHLSQNLIVESMIDSDFMETSFVSENGTFITAIPIQRGNTKIYAVLKGLKVKNEMMAINPPIKGSLVLDVYDKIKVEPKFVVLPWDAQSKPSYVFTLTAQKTYGSVVWQTNNTDLVQVNTAGHCVVTGKGVSSVTVSLAVNPHNNDKAEIIVTEVSQLKIVNSNFEFEIGSSLKLLISMTTNADDRTLNFSMCHKLALSLKLHDPNFQALDFSDSSANNSCAQVEVLSKSAGFTTVTVKYKNLNDSVVIGAYKPLRVLSPTTSESVLALGTSRVVVFEGGPLPWIKKPQSYFVEVESSNNNEDITIELLKSVENMVGVHAVVVECHQIGTFTFTIRVANKASASLPFPVFASATAKIICAVPDTIVLKSALPIPSHCPITEEQKSIAAFSNLDLSLHVIVLDVEGRQFDNVSTLAFEWTNSDDSIAHFERDNSKLYTHSLVYGFAVPKAVEQLVVPHNVESVVEMRVKITGYADSALSHKYIPTMTDFLRVDFVEAARVNPHAITLFNHPDNKGKLNIHGGSGYFSVENNATNMVQLEYLEENHSIMVSPIHDGDATVHIKDLCLIPATSFTTAIRISSLGAIDLRVKDRVQVNDFILAEVIAMDKNGFQIPVHHSMQIEAKIKSKIIEVGFVELSSSGKAIFRVKATGVGDTTLRMSCKSNNKVIFSRTKPVQVFSPLTILPKNITLVVGAVFQVETRGGPYPDASVTYTLRNSTVCEISSNGVITALSRGVSAVFATSLIHYSDGEELVVKSKNSLQVNVNALRSIRIESPLRHIEVGAAMPLTAFGDAALESPFAFASASPHLVFDWSSSNERVAVIESLYSNNDVIYSKENLARVALKALEAGPVVISLKFKPTVQTAADFFQTEQNKILSAQIDVNVFEQFKLVNPQSEDARILLSPNSRTKIITNQDGSKIMYHLNECKAKTLSNDSVVTVSQDGVVKSGVALGDASVIVSLEREFGIFQSFTVLVEVRQISYMQANVARLMRAAENEAWLNAVPLGLSHHIDFLFRDNRGRIFTQTNSVIQFRPSRFDLLSINRGSSNVTLRVNSHSCGQTIVHVWDERNPAINEYIRINSLPAIHPHEVEVPIGSIVCFSSSLRGLYGQAGKWKSSSDALEIDESTGVAFSAQAGKVAISYSVSNDVSTVSEIKVVPISKVYVNVAQTPISNVILDDAFFVPVTFNSNDKGSCSTDEIANVRVPFVCSLKFDTFLASGLEARDVFSLSSTYLPGKGFGCSLQSLLVDTDVFFATSDVQLILKVVVVNSGSQSEVSSNETVVPFYPAAFLESHEIFVSRLGERTSVLLHGHIDLINSFVIKSKDEHIKFSLEPSDAKKANLLISADDAAWNVSPFRERHHVILVSSITRQVINIDVVLEESDTCSAQQRESDVESVVFHFFSRHQHLFFSLLCILIIAISVALGYSYLMGPGYRQTSNQAAFANSPSAPVFSSAGGTRSPILSPVNTSGRDLRHRSSPQRRGFSLWSVDEEPVYGDPLFRSSPRPAYDGSPTY